jgi:hypothetical protein
MLKQVFTSSKILLAMLAFPLSSHADNGGRLPRGQAPVVTPTKVPEKGGQAAPVTNPGMNSAQKQPASKYPCEPDFASPRGTEGYFTPDGGLFYFMAPVKPAEASPGDLRRRYRYNILQMDMKTRQITVLAATDLPEVDAIVPHGNPVQGITAIIWQGESIPCHYGDANYVTFSLNSTMPSLKNPKLLVPKAVQDQGPVAVVESSEFPQVYNIKRRSILELDFELFQTRHTVLSTPEAEIPLYSEISKRMQYTWRPQRGSTEEPKGLVAYKNAKDAAAKLQFKGDDKLLQQGKLFGVSKYDFKSNSIKIVEVAKWSGMPNFAEFIVTLPREFSIRESEIKINFAKRLILVAGQGLAGKRIWHRIFIYDYQNGWELGPAPYKGNSFVSYGDIDPTGAYAVTALSNGETGLLEQILVFSFNTRKWLAVKLPEFR